MHDDVDLDIRVPNGITLKLGNGIAVKKQNLKNQNKKLIERKQEKEEQEDLNPADINEMVNKSVQSAQKMVKDFDVQIPPVHVTTGFGQSGIIDGDISIGILQGLLRLTL